MFVCLFNYTLDVSFIDMTAHLIVSECQSLFCLTRAFVLFNACTEWRRISESQSVRVTCPIVGTSSSLHASVALQQKAMATRFSVRWSFTMGLNEQGTEVPSIRLDVEEIVLMVKYLLEGDDEQCGLCRFIIRAPTPAQQNEMTEEGLGAMEAEFAAELRALKVSDNKADVDEYYAINDAAWAWACRGVERELTQVEWQLDAQLEANGGKGGKGGKCENICMLAGKGGESGKGGKGKGIGK